MIQVVHKLNIYNAIEYTGDNKEECFALGSNVEEKNGKIIVWNYDDYDIANVGDYIVQSATQNVSVLEKEQMSKYWVEVK